MLLHCGDCGAIRSSSIDGVLEEDHDADCGVHSAYGRKES